MSLNKDIARLESMSDEEVQQIWDAIWSLDRFDRPDDDWCELVYHEITRRELRSGPEPFIGPIPIIKL